MNCYSCQAVLPPGARFCIACGTGVMAGERLMAAPPGVVGYAPAMRPIFDRTAAALIRRRIRTLNNWSLGCFLGGLCLMGAGVAIPGPAALLLSLPGVLAFMAAFFLYPPTKGRNPLWGMGFMAGCLGLILLYFLGKKCLNCRAEAGWNADACATCGAPLKA